LSYGQIGFLIGELVVKGALALSDLGSLAPRENSGSVLAIDTIIPSTQNLACRASSEFSDD
jgi:hypothetical protein